MNRIDPPAILVRLGEGRSVSLGGKGVVFHKFVNDDLGVLQRNISERLIRRRTLIV